MIKTRYRLFRLRRNVYAKRMKGVEHFTFKVEAQRDYREVRVVGTEQGKTIYLDPKFLDEDGSLWWFRMRPILATFSRIQHTDFEAHVSMCDGDSNQGVDQTCLYFCDNREGVPMLVDPYFYHSKGYTKYSKAEPIPWSRREAKLVWRGSTTGKDKQITATEMHGENHSLCQRTRLALLAKQHEYCDVKFTQLVQSCDSDVDHRRLMESGLLGEWVDEQEMAHFRYALDVDGNTNSWSHFFKLARLGCCIFKVASPFGYRQWYSDQFEAMRHFIPVRADLADFQEKLDWAFSHPEACEDMATAALTQAQSMTIESELEQTARAIGCVL